MADPVISSSTIEERKDLGTGDAGLYAYWMGQEAIAGKEERQWIKKARTIVKRYRDERSDASGATVQRYNILWSNVQTLKPTLYARTPKPDIARRFNSDDDTGRLASTLLERCLSYAADCMDFDDVQSSCVEDRLLPGRGTARVVYVPTYGEPIEADETNAQFEQEGDAAVTVDSAGDTKAPNQGQDQSTPEAQPQVDPLREVVYEEVILKYLFWEDYREGPARKWVEVPWVRYRAYMNRDELETRFGKAKAEKVQLDYTPKGTPEDRKDETAPDIFKKAVIHEYWDKTKKQVVWLAPGTPDLILDTKDDPLGLRDFFPNPDPLLATTTNDKRIPVPDYIEYQDQAIEIDNLTARISQLTKALKVAGIYPGAEKQVLQQLVDAGTSNLLIPVEDWAKWTDNGGLKEFIQWMPIEQVAQTLIQLYEARDKTKSDLYEITGIGDIMRGNTSPIETLGAQQLKVNFVTRRVVPQQRQVARFARDCFRLMANVIAEHFSNKTISLMTGYPQLKSVPQVPPPPPQFLAPNPMALPQQPPQPQMGAPAGQPPAPPQAQPNPAYAQWQQAAQQAQAIQAKNQQLQQQFDAAVALIKQDGVYGFRIDIEADSTIAPDEQAEKQARTEFLHEFVPFMQQLVPIAQGNPQMAELAKQFALFGVRGFRVARPLEESVEAAFDALAQMPPHPSTQPKQSSGNVDSPADLALRNKEIDTKAQLGMAELGLKERQAAATETEAAARLQMEDKQHTTDATIKATTAIEDARFKRDHAAQLEAKAARGLT